MKGLVALLVVICGVLTYQYLTVKRQLNITIDYVNVLEESIDTNCFLDVVCETDAFHNWLEMLEKEDIKQ